MKTQALRILLLLLAFVALARAEEKIVSVDARASTVVIQEKNSLKTIHFNSLTDISINGAKATGAQLKAGMFVDISLADAQNASRIAARGNVGVAGTATPAGATPAPGFSGFSTPMTRRIVIKALVDASDHWIIQNGKLHIEHIDWKEPANIVINGIKWNPNWNGKVTDDFTAFSPPLAPFTSGNLTVRKAKGRGDVSVLEAPTEANGYKLVVLLRDKGNGAGEHEVHISW